MGVKTNIGTTAEIFLGRPATNDQAGVDALTGGAFIGEVVSYSTFGGTATVLTHTPVDTGVINKAQGPIDYGNVDIQLGKDTVDAGQIALASGFDGANKGEDHTIVITESDGYREAFVCIITANTTDLGDGGGRFIGAASQAALKEKPIKIPAP